MRRVSLKDKGLRIAYARTVERFGPPMRGGSLAILGRCCFEPVIALIAGILILLMPRLLNYVVAIYLIAIGILGLVGNLQ